MKQVAFEIPDREYELIARIANLEGVSVDTFALRATRPIANSELGENVA